MRTQLATKAQIAPQAILNDQTLYMLAAIKPKTPKEIQSLPSITHTKYAQYGYKFLNLILAHQKELTTTT
jgi:superfamily II DNA helicase RecQ